MKTNRDAIGAITLTNAMTKDELDAEIDKAEALLREQEDAQAIVAALRTDDDASKNIVAQAQEAKTMSE